MEVKQNPFSFYDFLGYFIPGSIVIYLFILVHHHASGMGAPNEVASKLSLTGVGFYLPFILVSYVVGHFINYLSSITVEKYSNWMYGYPSKNLLGYQVPDYFYANKQKNRRSVLRAVVFLFMSPISIVDYFLAYRLRLDELFTKPLDPLLRKIIKKRVVDLLKNHAELDSPEGTTPADADFFRYMYHFAVENAPNHLAKMQNYVALYGLLRTITFCSVIFFWVVLWHLSYSRSEFPTSIAVLLSVMAVSYIFFMGFMKFYRRFSLEAMMAASVSYKRRS